MGGKRIFQEFRNVSIPYSALNTKQYSELSTHNNVSRFLKRNLQNACMLTVKIAGSFISLVSDQDRAVHCFNTLNIDKTIVQCNL